MIPIPGWSVFDDQDNELGPLVMKSEAPCYLDDKGKLTALNPHKMHIGKTK